MPILSETESAIIEHLKQGHTLLSIAETIKKDRCTVNAHIRRMIRQKYIKRLARGSYEILIGDYQVKKYRPRGMPQVPSQHAQKWIEQTKRMITVELSEDQLLYLDNHRQMKRTLLAKKLGISKLQLCYVLEQRRNGA